MYWHIALFKDDNNDYNDDENDELKNNGKSNNIDCDTSKSISKVWFVSFN
jgi:hypothetical protein